MEGLEFWKLKFLLENKNLNLCPIQFNELFNLNLPLEVPLTIWVTFLDSTPQLSNTYLFSKKPISSSKGKEYRLSKPKYL